MKTYNSRRGLFIGAFIFAFLVFAAGVGMWLFSRNTDNRSQASAMPVAEVRVISQKSDGKMLTHNVLMDISQMKKGTTVTDFSAQIFVVRKIFTPPDRPVTQMPRPSYSPSSPTFYPRPSSYAPSPKVVTITGAQMPVGNPSVLGVNTSEPVRYDANELPPDALIGPEANQVPSVNFPQNNVLAQSKDGVLRVEGVGQFAKLQNLKVTVETSDKGYLIAFSGQASTKDAQLQQAFSQPQALFSILSTETQAAVLAPTVEKASVRGYLPGMKTAVELTSPIMVKPTLAPTDKPPVVVSKCRSTKDCPKGYTCTQPRVPNCPPGKVCKTLMADWQCTLMPSPTVKKEPSARVSGRPPIIIKTIQ